MNIVFGNGTREFPQSLLNKDYSSSYAGRYPNGLNLKPGEPAHQRLLSKLIEYALASEKVIKQRHPTWKDLDRTLTAFVPARTLETGVTVQKTQKVIIFPAMFSLMDVMLSNLLTAFLDEPIYRYRWTGQEDMIGSILLERVVNLQNRRSKTGLAIHTMLRDALVYGFGLVVPTWREVHGRVVGKEQKSQFGLDSILSFLGLGEAPAPKYSRVLKDGIVNEGVYLENVDPYLVLPDPNVPIEQVSSGSFIGWLRPSNLYDKLEMEKAYPRSYFNAQYLQDLTAGYGRSIVFKDERNEKTDVAKDSLSSAYGRPMDDIEMQMRIIPSEFGLGSSTQVERWRFVVTADCVITCAHKLEYPFDHSFQAVVCAPEYDGHSALPISRLELNYGLQNFIDFSFSSHIENVKRVINDMLVVDPSMIVMSDLANTGAGARIRLRRKSFGGDVNKAITQLKVQDVTKDNVNDAVLAIGLMEKFYGASEQAQGVVRNRGERVSATEAKDTNLGGLRRTDRIVKVAGMQAMYDLAGQTALMTQWYKKEGIFVELTGRGEQMLRREFGDENKQVYVSPEDLAVRTDVEPYDAPSFMPIEDPQAVIQAMTLMKDDPELAAAMDKTRVFLYAMRLLGFQNVQDFQKANVPAQVQPTAEVMNQVNQGNLVPVGTPSNIGAMLGA